MVKTARSLQNDVKIAAPIVSLLSTSQITVLTWGRELVNTSDCKHRSASSKRESISHGRACRGPR